jgi:hypothetical protein
MNLRGTVATRCDPPVGDADDGVFCVPHSLELLMMYILDFIE